MTDLIIRDLDPQTTAGISARAARNGRSFEAEARSILEQAALGATALSVIEKTFPAESRLDGREYRVFTAAAEASDTYPDTPSL